MRIPLNNIVQFVLSQCNKYNIDETHALNHALNVLNYSKQIYNEEVNIYEKLKQQQHVIYTSALMHDICDSKYTDEKKAINEIQEFLISHEYKPVDISVIKQIISTMSYHKIKENGFPDLGDYQQAFHVVREADLLTAYDFNRMLLYGVYQNTDTYETSFLRSKQLYMDRVDKHYHDGLLTTQYAKRCAADLNARELTTMRCIESLLYDES
jgi:HD superfamily phosphodiesterase